MKIASGEQLTVLQCGIIKNDNPKYAEYQSKTPKPSQIPPEFLYSQKILSSETIQLPTAPHVPVLSLSFAKLVQELSRDLVYLSTNPTESLCDAVTLTSTGTLFLWQMTIGKTHSVVATTFDTYVSDVQTYNQKNPSSPIQRIFLVFVVPCSSKFALQQKELKLIDQKKEAGATAVPPIKVLSGILELTPKRI